MATEIIVKKTEESILIGEVNKLLKNGKFLKGQSGVSDSTSKVQLQYLIALATEKLERNKAIQVTLLFVGVILSILIAAYVNYYGSDLGTYILLAASLLIAATYLENRFKNGVGKSARLREMLIFLEKCK
ncbi:hypothetical protein [Exiguobacterium sp. NG55]|uniref:hypothetical protein n=1 Tax=Exiguobacterium sp. NG55 TaxID=375477 RepID=UPI0004DFBE01|nr:hypothetical protein [Exiguobacterium sp. NG55]